MSRSSKFTWFVLLAVAIVAVAVLLIHGHTVAVLQPRGQIAQKERNLIILASLMTLIVVIPVFSLLFGIIWKYRENNAHHATYKPDWDGSRILETIWWTVPSVLILVLGVIIWNSSHELDPSVALRSGVTPMTIQVVALDWKWLFIYPEQHIATVNYVQFPVNTPVDFEITADAPMNSFWIPQLGGQIYAMPGMSTQLHLIANTAGNFRGSSANLSGRGFAGMKFIAKADTPTDFEQWKSTVGQSSNSLNMATYNKLAKDSENNPIAYYSSADTNLYNTVINKYMGPVTQMQAMDMEGMDN